MGFFKSFDLMDKIILHNLYMKHTESRSFSFCSESWTWCSC